MSHKHITWYCDLYFIARNFLMLFFFLLLRLQILFKPCKSYKIEQWYGIRQSIIKKYVFVFMWVGCKSDLRRKNSKNWIVRGKLKANQSEYSLHMVKKVRQTTQFNILRCQNIKYLVGVQVYWQTRNRVVFRHKSPRLWTYRRCLVATTYFTIRKLSKRYCFLLSQYLQRKLEANMGPTRLPFF